MITLIKPSIDKKRSKAYHNLIQRLLEYPVGEEIELLNQNCHLLDEELIKLLLEESVIFIDKRQLIFANKLMYITTHILHFFVF
jgi:hypothetical protein